MANYSTLKTAIQSVIKTNGNNEITGALLQSSLLSMINSLGYGYQFVGVATPTTNPGTPDQKIFYVAIKNGTYVNFNNIVVSGGITILKWDTQWQSETLNVPFFDDVKPNYSDVIVSYFNGYISYESKIVVDTRSGYKTICKRVLPGKVYSLYAPATKSSFPYYVFTTDIEGQNPVNSRVNYSSGYTLITAPATANYLFVNIQFNSIGDYNLYSLIEYDLRLNEFATINNNISGIYREVFDTTLHPFNGYVDVTNKVIPHTGAYYTAGLRVLPGKQYVLCVKNEDISSFPYYVFTSDIEGQNPVGTRMQYGSGITIVTAPDNANYLYVNMVFNGNGNAKGYSIIELNDYIKFAYDKATQTQEIFTTESKNVYNQSKVNGYITSDTGNIAGDSRYLSTGLIPVKPNSIYNIAYNRCSVSSARCLGADKTTKYKLLSAVTSAELTSWRIPNPMGTGSVTNGQFKTPANAAYLQFTIDFNQALVDPEKIMVEYVGTDYDANFVPSTYQPYLAKTIVSEDALPSVIAELPARVTALEEKSANAPKILLIGSSHGMNTIGQFPMLAYHSGLTDIICANAYQGSLSLQQLAEYCTSGDTFAGWYKKFYNGVWHDSQSATIEQMLLDEKWDVISLQRSASEDMTWTDEQAGYLDTILAFITEKCDWSPKIVFNSGFADSYSIATREQQQADTNTIWNTAQQVKTNYGIEIIPMAPALQLLRNNDTLASLGSYAQKMLSCDSQHLDQGIGMYASGCICFNFFLQHLNKSILTSKYLPSVADMQPFWYDASKFTAITETNAKLVRKIVCQYFVNN